MSVCFYVREAVNADQVVGTSGSEEPAEQEASVIQELCCDPLQDSLQTFWTKAHNDINKTTADDFKTQALPLARIKKIMKLDDEVKMISAEAPVLFAKAAEIFIHELTLRAWSHTEDNKRRTLQRNDIAMAISKSDQFDFLIDIVPRHESIVIKPPKKEPIYHMTATEPVVSQQSAQQQTPAQPQIVLQPSYTQIVQPTSAPSSSGAQNSPAVVLQQVVANNDIQVPLQLTQAQLNMIRFQMQNNPTQPIIIQAHTPQAGQGQIIQVASQQQPQQQVYLQVASQEGES